MYAYKRQQTPQSEIKAKGKGRQKNKRVYALSENGVAASAGGSTNRDPPDCFKEPRGPFRPTQPSQHRQRAQNRNHPGLSMSPSQKKKKKKKKTCERFGRGCNVEQRLMWRRRENEASAHSAQTPKLTVRWELYVLTGPIKRLPVLT